MLLCTVAPGARAQGTQPYTFGHDAMATGWTLVLYSTSRMAAESASTAAFDEIDRIEQLLSNYRPSSELSRINREAAAGWVTTDPEMMRFLQDSEHWSQVSDGAFDITVGALMKGWGFFRHAGAVPSDAAVQAMQAKTGWQKVELDAAAHAVHFAVPGLELDPGGIGKGFAVDAAIQVLRDAGVRAALLSAGSSTIYALGAPPGRPGWEVVIPGPLPSHATLSTITLHDDSLSSADCTQKHFVANGHEYCHIMDPRTGRPVEGRVQVSVTNPSATASDALSNVLFVLPPAISQQVLATAAPASQAIVVSLQGSRVQCTRIKWPNKVACTATSTRVDNGTGE